MTNIHCRQIFRTVIVLLLLLIGSIQSTWADEVETVIYSTNFQDWDSEDLISEEKTVTKNFNGGSIINFSLNGLYVQPTEKDTKLSQTCATIGQLKAEKNKSAYIKTSAIPQVTSVTFVHGATGNNRGWGLKVKGDGDSD